MCLDARKLNEILINDYECSEPIEAIFQYCASTKVMSTLELVMSFLEIPLSPESSNYTAFLFEGKCYEFCVTPFGLKTSTTALVRGLDLVLRGIGNFVLNFIDDLLCISKDINQHLEHLGMLFQGLEEQKLTVNFEKSIFFRQEGKFLGFILTPQGIILDPEKINALKQFPRPKNAKDLRTRLLRTG